MENKIDLSILENTGVRIDKLDKSLNETVKVLGDIKKTLKESNKKSAESKPASSGGGGGGAKSSGGTSLQESKNKVAEAAVKATGDVLTAIFGKAKSKGKDAGSGAAKTAASGGDSSEKSAKERMNGLVKGVDGYKNTKSTRAAAKKVMRNSEEGSEEYLHAEDTENRATAFLKESKKSKKESKKTDEYKKAKKENRAENIDVAADMTAVGGEAAIEVIDQLSAANKAAADEKRAAAEADNAKEKDDLKKKLDQQLITKKEYDKAVEASDIKLAQKKSEIAAEQAKKDKALNITKVIIDSAVAIMAAWKSGPIVGGIMTGVITGMAIAQIAAIEKAPIPKARKGGLIVGSSHEAGGVLIEAEGGEAILSRAAMSAFPGVASLMNAAALSGGISDGGYAARSMVSGSVEFGNREEASSSQGIDYERLSSMMSEKISQTKLYVAVTDINDGQQKYARISDMAKL